MAPMKRKLSGLFICLQWTLRNVVEISKIIIIITIIIIIIFFFLFNLSLTAISPIDAKRYNELWSGPRLEAAPAI